MYHYFRKKEQILGLNYNMYTATKFTFFMLAANLVPVNVLLHKTFALDSTLN